MDTRTAELDRTTNETDIKLKINLDGTGKYDINTGIGFFDHMLEGFAKHGMFDLELSCRGDLHVDGHHTVEDVGIVLGEALKKAAGDKAGIKRFGSFIIPMDETLMICAVDLSGRPYFVNDVKYSVEKVGEMDTEMVQEFFYAVSYSAGINLHFKMLNGNNNHHIIEACFKSFAKALDTALTYEQRLDGVWSTKGVL